MIKTDNNSLYHHGILGQKWGVRRFQNEDGSLTAKGRKRYAGGIDDSVYVAESKKWKSKDVDKLSDDELNRRNNRLQREQQYQNSTTPQWKKDVVSTAKEAAKKIAVTSLVTLLAAQSKDAIANKVGPLLKKYLPRLIPKAIKQPLASAAAAFIMNLNIQDQDYEAYVHGSDKG